MVDRIALMMSSRCLTCGRSFTARGRSRFGTWTQPYCSKQCSMVAFMSETQKHVRFMLKVRVKPGCWIWNGTIDADGYGRCKVNCEAAYAHRASWVFVNGPIPDGLVVCHRCDNPPCVRPSHLFLGTQRDNITDAVSKGRMCRGDAHPKRRAKAGRHLDPDLSRRSTDSFIAAKSRPCDAMSRPWISTVDRSEMI